MGRLIKTRFSTVEALTAWLTEEYGAMPVLLERESGGIVKVQTMDRTYRVLVESEIQPKSLPESQTEIHTEFHR